MCIVQCRRKSGDNFHPRLNRKTRAILVADLGRLVRPVMRPDSRGPLQIFPEFNHTPWPLSQYEASFGDIANLHSRGRVQPGDPCSYSRSAACRADPLLPDSIWPAWSRFTDVKPQTGVTQASSKVFANDTEGLASS